MTSQVSNSDKDAFSHLHEAVKKWIWQQNWQELRPVQEQTIKAIFDTNFDILISASTAAGKTEAAFLPILSKVAQDGGEQGLSVIYISPLKALINDQFRRLEDLCNSLEINLVRWHGDAPQSQKKKTIKNPSGVALITPESIEALLIRKPGDARRLLQNVQYIIIDELHSFLSGPRGLHLYSLLRRIDKFSKKRARRIGLSATLGDFSQAKMWMNFEEPSSVSLINPLGGSPELKLQIRTYMEPTESEVKNAEGEGLPIPSSAIDQISEHIFERVRGSNNLIFAGSRKRVEYVADRLRMLSDEIGVPNEFYPHHGNLSKDLREELEIRLKDGQLPTTAVATTTLELGIDIGSVKSIAQIGAPRSMSSLRQRLGRSGRRKGQPATLRIYIDEPKLANDSDVLSKLRLQVVQSVASINLLLQNFIEPVTLDPSLATVILHQILSLICEYGGLNAAELFDTISFGQFKEFEKSEFIILLRNMAANKLIEQSPDGLLMLGQLGEKITTSRDFYAIFKSDEEWRLINNFKTLGTIPLSNFVDIGSLVMFAGQRWRITAIDEAAKVLEVTRHTSANLPKFDGGDLEPIHDRLVEEIRFVYQSSDIPSYLSISSKQMLLEAREVYARQNLANTGILEQNRNTHIFLWQGSLQCSLLTIVLLHYDLKSEHFYPGVITVHDINKSELLEIIRKLILEPPNLIDLSEHILNICDAKFDEYVSPEVLKSLWIKRNKLPLSQLMASLAKIV